MVSRKIVAERLGIRVIEVKWHQHDLLGMADAESRNGEPVLRPVTGYVVRGTTFVPAGEGIALERRELGRTRNPPTWVTAAPDVGGARTNVQSSRDTKRRKAPG